MGINRQTVSGSERACSRDLSFGIFMVQYMLKKLICYLKAWSGKECFVNVKWQQERLKLVHDRQHPSGDKS